MRNLLALLTVAVATTTQAVTVVRGPYLNSGTPSGMVVKWRTDIESDTVIRYGTNVAALNAAITNLASSTEHEIAISGLNADTTYFYAIGTTTSDLGGGADYFFRTSPTNTRPVRIWAIGDFGTANWNQANVRDAYYEAAGGELTDVWLMLGDNAYYEGTDYQFQWGVFDMYPTLLRNTVAWPTIGNHETGSVDPNTGLPPYLTIFTLPSNGEAGGVPSGSELYYSFDYANIHFVCLDSQMSSRSKTGPMANWLRADLAATTKDWIIAYFHHPPYSWGTHDSDYDGQLIEMRENFLPILEDYGADLVLAGHSHVYERTFLLDRHYGTSWTLSPTNIIDGSMGNPYRKPAGGLGAHQGSVYVTCGNSGQGGVGNFNLHPACAINDGGFGSMIIDVNTLVMNVTYLNDAGESIDTFTLDKSQPTSVRPKMTVQRNGTNAVVSWPTSLPVYSLQAAGQVPSTNWQTVGISPATNGRRNVLTLPASETNQFFRLKTP